MLRHAIGMISRRVKKGDAAEMAVRFVAHDGDADEAAVVELYKLFRQEIK